MATPLPNHQDYERYVLGALLVFPSAREACMDLSQSEFYLPAHQTIYGQIQHLIQSGQTLDFTTLIGRLNETNQLNMVGGADYIVSLADEALSPVNVPTYVEQIKNKAQLRQLISASQNLNQLAYNTQLDMDTLLDEAERAIMNVTRNRRGKEFISSQEAAARVLEELANLRNAKGVTGIKCGFVDLERMTNGFHRGDLIILAARPAMGKSALALNFVANVAQANPGAVAMFSLEMPTESLMKRLLASDSRVFANKLQSGRLTDQEMNRLHESANRLSQRNIYIDDTSSLKVSQIFSKCRKLVQEHGSLSLVVIDYLQLLSGSRNDSRQQEVSDISRNLKILAKELDCPVIALSQLSRRVEERENHQPQLSDLRESGSIEQDADIVMFLYREAYYKRGEQAEEVKKEQVEKVQLILAKHRNGSVGEVSLSFEPSISHFSNYSKVEEFNASGPTL